MLGCSNNQTNNSEIKNAPPAKMVETDMRDTLPSKVKHSTDDIANDDTIFLFRKLSAQNYNAIFIERNRESRIYKKWTNLKFDKKDSEEFFMYCKNLKERNLILRRFNIQNLLSEWLQLHEYKGKYYLYVPCDGMYRQDLILTDSLLIQYGMMGPIPSIIDSFVKIRQSRFKIVLSDSAVWDGLFLKEVNIHFIDLSQKIAVWKFTYQYFNNSKVVLENQFRLYVMKENAKKFDMIVNFSKFRKEREFEFDSIDFRKLIGGI